MNTGCNAPRMGRFSRICSTSTASPSMPLRISGVADRHVYLDPCRNQHHDVASLSSAETTRFIVSASTSRSNRTRRPPISSISIPGAGRSMMSDGDPALAPPDASPAATAASSAIFTGREAASSAAGRNAQGLSPSEQQAGRYSVATSNTRYRDIELACLLNDPSFRFLAKLAAMPGARSRSISEAAPA